MPQIPRVTVADTPIQIAQQPKARNVDVSSGLSQLGKAIGQVSQLPAAFKKENDILSAEDAMVSFDAAKNNALFNSENGYYNTQGRSAMDGADGIRKTLDDIMKQHINGLKSTESKAMFQKAATARNARDTTAIMRHAAKGQQTWQLNTSKAEESNAVKNAALYYNDDKELSTYLGAGELAVLGRKNLIGTERTTRALEVFRSSFAKSAILGALSRNDVNAADELKNKYGNLLEGSDSITVETKINAEREKQATTKAVAEIYAPGKPLKEMLTEARSTDENITKEVERQLSNMNSADQRAQQQWVTDTVNEKDQAISVGEMFYRDVPEDELKLIGKTGRDVLKAAEKEFATGENVMTDYLKYTDLMSLPPKQLSKVNPLNHYKYLGKTERNKLNTAVVNARKGKEDKTTGFERTKATALSSSIKEIYGKKPDADEVNAFARLVSDTVNAQGVTDMVGYEKVLEQLTTEKIIEKPWYRPDVKYNVKAIPPEHLGEVSDFLRKGKAKLTPENLVKAYDYLRNEGSL